MVTRTVPAGEFKARCLALMDDVESGSLEIIVTKRGRPVARLSAIAPPARVDLSDSIVFEGDIVSPMGIVWDATR